MENLSLYSVSFLTFSALPQTALALTDLGTFTYPTSTALESVNKYAVFAQTYNKNNHMEGTIAANYINAGTDAFGVTSAVEQYVDKDEAFCYFAHVVGLGNMIAANTDSQGRDWNVIMPDDATLDYSYNNGNGITISHIENGTTVSTSFNNATDLGKTVSRVSDTTYQTTSTRPSRTLRRMRLPWQPRAIRASRSARRARTTRTPRPSALRVQAILTS